MFYSKAQCWLDPVINNLLAVFTKCDMVGWVLRGLKDCEGWDKRRETWDVERSRSWLDNQIMKQTQTLRLNCGAKHWKCELSWWCWLCWLSRTIRTKYKVTSKLLKVTKCKMHSSCKHFIGFTLVLHWRLGRRVEWNFNIVVLTGVRCKVWGVRC